MSGTIEHPKVFISYAWTSPDHEALVLDLATSLRSNGVDAILDKWDLRPGQDKYVFMESMVTDPNIQKVLVLCDKRYQEKADLRTGGVGTESQIISAEVYSKVQVTKFIPLICEYDEDGKPCLPVFLKGRIYIDISDEVKYGSGLEELLRQIYDQPFHQKPRLGSAPAFLKPDGGLVQVREFAAALRAIQDGKAIRQGLEQLFTQAVFKEVKGLYAEPADDQYDEVVYQEIVATKGIRDQLEAYFDALASFSVDTASALTPALQLFDKLGLLFGLPTKNGTYYPGWADLYRFFALEALLLLTASLIRYERWASLKRLMGFPFTVATAQNEGKISTFVAFDTHLVSIDEHRNYRLKLNRVSASADMLKERCSDDGITFAELRQADFLLSLRSIVDFDPEGKGYRRTWQARTSVLGYESKLPLFEKAINADVREGIRTALNVPNAEEMKRRVEFAETALNGFGHLRADRYATSSFAEITNLSALMK